MFTKDELEMLKTLLFEEAQRMDDDGNDGAFEASPFAKIYDKVCAELEGAK